MKNIKHIIALYLLLGVFVISISSCKKDIEGCMDATAENFDSEATVDNGLCTYARDKFIGMFVGNLACQAPLPNDEEFTITFAEGLTDNTEVEISFQNTETPIPVLVGNVSGNTIIIAETDASVALDPAMPDDKIDLTFSGEAVLDETGNNLTGELRVFVQVFNQTLKCDISATKQ